MTKQDFAELLAYLRAESSQYPNNILQIKGSEAAALVDEIERLQRRVAELEHAARIHAETIKEMQRAHAEEIRAMREEIRDAVAEARWSQHEDGW